MRRVNVRWMILLLGLAVLLRPAATGVFAQDGSGDGSVPSGDGSGDGSGGSGGGGGDGGGSAGPDAGSGDGGAPSTPAGDGSGSGAGDGSSGASGSGGATGGDGGAGASGDGGAGASGDGSAPAPAPSPAAGDGATAGDGGGTGDGATSTGDGSPASPSAPAPSPAASGDGGSAGDGGGSASGDGSSTASGDGSSTGGGDGAKSGSGDGATSGSGDGANTGSGDGGAGTGDGQSLAGDGGDGSPTAGGDGGTGTGGGDGSPSSTTASPAPDSGSGTAGSGTSTTGDGGQPPAAAPSKPLTALTQDQARELMLKMGDEQAKAGYSPDHVPDGCYWRGHLGEQTAQSYGVDPSVVQRAQLTAPGFFTGNIPANGSLTTSDPKTGDQVSWGYHTAPVIPVQQADGSVKPMVFDPAAGNSDPVEPETWAKSLTGQSLASEPSTAAKPDDPGFDASKGHLVVGPGSTTNPDNAGMFPGFGPASVDEAKSLANQAYTQDYDPNSDWAKSHGNYNTGDRYVWHNRPQPPRLVKPPSAD